MAIRPVTSVSFGTHSNRLAFEGRKDRENHRPSYVSNTIKSIPLATLIALSPLNSQNVSAIPSFPESPRIEMVDDNIDILDRKDVVEYKDFKSEDFETRVNLVKDKQNPGAYRIWVDFDCPYDDELGTAGYLSAFNHIKYTIVGDDNKQAGTVVFDNAFIENFEHNPGKSYGLSDPKVCSYVNELVKRYKTDVPEKNISKYLIPRTEGYLTTDSRLSSLQWINEAKQKGQYWGKTLRSWEINTDDGVYTVFACDRDQNSDNFEVLAIEKEGGPTMQVSGIVSSTAKFSTLDRDIKNVDLYQINVTKKGMGEYSIHNEKLWNFLLELYQLPQNNNAFTGVNGHYEYSISESGSPTVYTK